MKENIGNLLLYSPIKPSKLSNRGLTNTHTAIPIAHARASLIPDYLFCRYTIKKLRIATIEASSPLIDNSSNAPQ